MSTINAVKAATTGLPGAGALGLIKPIAKNVTRLRVEPRAAEFLIVGTGRCGTVTVSEHLTRSGIPCTHEQAFSLCGPTHAHRGVGDASWLGLRHLDGYNGSVVHLIREPALVVQSLVRLRFFSRRRNPYLWYARLCLPGLTGDDVDDSITWCEWANATAERHADFTVRLEDFVVEPEPLVSWLAERHGSLAASSQADEPVRWWNHKTHEKAADPVEAFGPSHEQRLRDLNRRYGYE